MNMYMYMYVYSSRHVVFEKAMTHSALERKSTILRP